MRLSEVESLDTGHSWWVPAVVAPQRDWLAAPGCRKGARYMVDRDTLTARRDAVEVFDSRLACLNWILMNRARLNDSLPDAPVRAVRLDRWLLGMDS